MPRNPTTKKAPKALSEADIHNAVTAFIKYAKDDLHMKISEELQVGHKTQAGIYEEIALYLTVVKKQYEQFRKNK